MVQPQPILDAGSSVSGRTSRCGMPRPSRRTAIAYSKVTANVAERRSRPLVRSAQISLLDENTESRSSIGGEKPFSSLLSVVADTSMSGKRVDRELKALVARRGRPRTIVSDNARSSPRTPPVPDAWLKASPGIISLRQADADRLLRELQRRHARRDLHVTLFLNLRHTRAKLPTWATDYKTERPRSGLGYLTPAVKAALLTATGDRLRNPDQVRPSPVARVAPDGVSTRQDLIATG